MGRKRQHWPSSSQTWLPPGGGRPSAGCWDSRLKSPVPEVQAATSGQWNKKTPLGLVKMDQQGMRWIRGQFHHQNMMLYTKRGWEFVYGGPLYKKRSYYCMIMAILYKFIKMMGVCSSFFWAPCRFIYMDWYSKKVEYRNPALRWWRGVISVSGKCYSNLVVYII